MAFDKPTRNRLAAFVAEARRLITDEFTQQFQSLYGIGETSLTELSQLGHLDDAGLAVAGLLRERIDYLVKTHPEDKAGLRAAVDRLAREQAFTVLNRLAAVRMAEKRGLIAESVGNGYQSKGFKVFEQVARSGLGEIYQRYRRYLFCLFDELAIDLGVLFDRRSPQGLLFPRENTMLDLLNLLNGPELEPLWQEDETIGWIYQYYNDPAERKKMREESAAPRNSRELAVRNQFFTPRYVVEFLTDNTLGRIWYEMTGGETRLKEQCRYLVRRPTEIFLGPEETAPELPEQEGLSQEELLRQPVYIPHRALKDPRQLRMLDPACGSMHFGLYAFDLYEVIYEEAWNRGMESLRADFPERDALLREIPRLIIEHNIHGVDIDPRAVQIAGLSLWLRAQRSWQQQRMPARQRPQIRRSNIVCAEPMPGDKAMLREFIATQFTPEEQPAFTFLLERVFDRMALAGEAGSLLKIEEEISEAVREAKGLWKKGPQYKPGYLFAEAMPKKPEQLRLDLSGISEEGFWETAEERIYAALQIYAGQAESDSYQRRLFADDTVQGFAFIDLCRTRYDVALMNPPFGDASLPSKSYIDETYGDTKGDVYKAFVECLHTRLIPDGYLGIISSRTGFFLSGSEDWRTRVVLRLFRPITLADLGSGVLDAMVEVAAYVLRNLSKQESHNLTLSLVPVLENVVRDRQDRFSIPKWQSARDDLKRHQAIVELEHLANHGYIKRCIGDIVRYTPIWHAVKKVTAPPPSVYPPLVCIRALDVEDKSGTLANGVRNPSNRQVFVANPEHFTQLPGHSFAYWAPNSLKRIFRNYGMFETEKRRVRQGGVTGNDTKYLRAWWEVKSKDAAPNDIQWVPYAKGGKFSPFFSDIPLVVRWHFSRCTFFSFTGLPHRPSEKPSSADSYFSKGLTWPLRAHRFAPVPLPSNSVFSIRGYAILCDDEKELLPLLAIGNSAVFDFIFKLALGRFGFPEFVVGILQKLPLPTISNEFANSLALNARRAWAIRREFDTIHSTSHTFHIPALLIPRSGTLTERAAVWATLVSMNETTFATLQAEIDNLVFRFYRLDANDRAALTVTHITESTGLADAETDEDDSEEIASADAPTLTADLLAYAIGCVFGRWDIRYATGARPAPELPDPFDPLPICPPGMLQGEDGLPLTAEAGRQLHATGDYPLDIAWDGILVVDPGHPLDLEHRLREVFTVLWGDRAEGIEQEACEILGVKSLRDYFRKPSGFFADHLKRYSKSRRQAPIYWPLSTAKGSYTLWIYYHRLSDQTLHTALADFVDPKIKDVRAEISLLRESNNNRSRLEELLDLEGELLDFQAEIERIIKLPWQPNLNDGVLITAAPLWRLFRLPKWQKDLKACWDKLEKGEYDWAHLAYSIWPKRVEEVCKKDRSIAIAHGLEHLCQVEPPKPKAKRGRKKAE